MASNMAASSCSSPSIRNASLSDMPSPCVRAWPPRGLGYPALAACPQAVLHALGKDIPSRASGALSNRSLKAHDQCLIALNCHFHMLRPLFKPTTAPRLLGTIDAVTEAFSSVLVHLVLAVEPMVVVKNTHAEFVSRFRASSRPTILRHTCSAPWERRRTDLRPGILCDLAFKDKRCACPCFRGWRRLFLARRATGEPGSGVCEPHERPSAAARESLTHELPLRGESAARGELPARSALHPTHRRLCRYDCREGSATSQQLARSTLRRSTVPTAWRSAIFWRTPPVLVRSPAAFALAALGVVLRSRLGGLEVVLKEASNSGPSEPNGSSIAVTQMYGGVPVVWTAGDSD